MGGQGQREGKLQATGGGVLVMKICFLKFCILSLRMISCSCYCSMFLTLIEPNTVPLCQERLGKGACGETSTAWLGV